jgi:hypothetical protein
MYLFLAFSLHNFAPSKQKRQKSENSIITHSKKQNENERKESDDGRDSSRDDSLLK